MTMSVVEKYCKKCGRKLNPDDVRCPYCGSTAIEYRLTLSEKIELHESLRIKQKRPGKKAFIRKIKTGDDWSYDLQRWVHREMDVDVVNDKYGEIVIDKITGYIIHIVEEPLSLHRSGKKVH